MRIFVTEFIVGGGLANHPLPEGLKQEGLMMLQALLSDCACIDDVELQTSLDFRVKLNLEGVETMTIQADDSYMQLVKQIASDCDYTWIIAPESEGVLEQMITELGDENLKLINSDASSVRICSDKLICSQYMRDADIATIPILDADELEYYQGSVIAKKRYGAGCEGLRIFDSGIDAKSYAQDVHQWIVQPYYEGQHKSLSVLCSNGDARVLSCNQQILSQDDQPILEACLVNQAEVTEYNEGLAVAVAKCFPGLKAYVGIDFVEVNGKAYVVDINPRLSTSYVGLRKVLHQNPAKLCIDTVMKNLMPKNVERNKDLIEVSLG